MDNVQLIDGSQILKVTAEGLTYLDVNGREAYIDFAQCYSNYFQDFTSPAHIERMKELNPQFRWDEEGVAEYIEKRKRWKYIGERNVLTPPWADGPYLEFYTEPRTRFKFATEDDYGEVRDVLEQARWRTYDRS